MIILFLVMKIFSEIFTPNEVSHKNFCPTFSKVGGVKGQSPICTNISHDK